MTIQWNDIFFGYFFSVVAETTDGSLLVCGVTIVGQVPKPSLSKWGQGPPLQVYMSFICMIGQEELGNGLFSVWDCLFKWESINS